jgi:hypothetical protein
MQPITTNNDLIRGMTRGIKAAKKPSRQDADDADGDDRISALPDVVLQHALGFLPPRDAVRTCVLGRRSGNLCRAFHHRSRPPDHQSSSASA